MKRKPQTDWWDKPLPNTTPKCSKCGGTVHTNTFPIYGGSRSHGHEIVCDNTNCKHKVDVGGMVRMPGESDESLRRRILLAFRTGK